MPDEVALQAAQTELEKAQAKYDKSLEQTVQDQKYVTYCKIEVEKITNPERFVKP